VVGEEKYRVYQCKREKNFCPAKIEVAVSKFLQSTWASKTDTFVLCTAENLVSNQRADTLEEQAELLRQQGINFLSWDSDELSAKLKDHPKLNETLTIPVCGEPRAPFFYVRPSKTSEFENYIKNHLNHAGKLIKGETLIKENYYGLFEPNKRLFDRTGDYILLMKKNYVFRDKLIGEARHELIGNHGGLSDDELFVPLIII